MNKEERVVKYINSSDDFIVNGKRYCENDFYNDVEDLAKENQELKELQHLLKIQNDYINELKQENQSLEKENKILRENAEHNDKVVDKVNWENQLLKKQLEEYKHKGLYNTCLPYSTGYKKAIKEKENQQKEFIDYLENEKNIYPYDISDYTYEDIINTILSKYYEIIGSGEQ